MNNKTDKPFVQNPIRDHREQYLQNPMDNIMYGVRDIDDLDASGKHHPDYPAYEAAQARQSREYSADTQAFLAKYGEIDWKAIDNA